MTIDEGAGFEETAEHACEVEGRVFAPLPIPAESTGIAGGGGAFPLGMTTVNRAPPPATLSTSILPRCCSTMPSDTERPSPVP